MNQSERASVAIVGCGPVGMVLAALLGNRGVEVVILDRAADVFPLPRAAHIDHTVLRTLENLGIAQDLLQQTVANQALVLADQDLQPLVTIPAGGIGRSGYPASMYFYQPEFDKYLDSYLRRMPNVRVLREVEMYSLEDDSDGVSVHCRSVVTGEELLVRADWVVGCDGSSSLVRELSGIKLTSLDFDEHWLVLDLRLEDAESHLPEYALQVCNPSRAWVSNPVPGGRYRVEIELQASDDIEVVSGLPFLREFLNPLLGETNFSVERDAVYAFHGLVADSWKNGHVLLAGDAAHQMPPFLGQGMCSGIRDADNLAWKLAGVVQGSFGSTILETYEIERAPHVKTVISSAIEVGKFVSESDPDKVRARNLALRAGQASRIPGFKIPVFLSGPLVGAGGGSQIPQVCPPGELPTLDLVLGPGFSIISRGTLDDAVLGRWRAIWGAKHLLVSDLGADSVAVGKWMDKMHANVVVVRPDRYVMLAEKELPDVVGRQFALGTAATLS